jgi:hypothetical protein
MGQQVKSPNDSYTLDSKLTNVNNTKKLTNLGLSIISWDHFI